MSQTETNDVVPVHLVAYEDDAELEIDNSGDNPTVANHDELVNNGDTFEEVRMLQRESAEEYDMDIIEPGDPLWCEEVSEMDAGDAVRVEELRD